MINRRQEQLVRDLASLIAKHRAEDWAFILSELRSGSEIQKRLAFAVAELLEMVDKRKPRRRSKAKGGPLKNKAAAKFMLKPDRSELLSALQQALMERTLLKTASELRDVSFQIGIKNSLPPNRSDAVRVVLSHLNDLPQDKMWQALSVLHSPDLAAKEKLESDYRRWFEVILKNAAPKAENSKPSD